jgi:uncharacterized protein
MGQFFRKIAGAFAILVGITGLASADPDYPAFSAPVVDAAHVLSDSDRAAIIQKLLDLQTKTGVQFAVATVPSLDGIEIEPYANGLFRNWKIGEKKVNNGLLLLVAPKEHKLRFEVGYGLEGTMTDLQAKLITRNTMVPKLKAGDTSGAIKAGVDDAITVLTTDKAGLPERLKPATDDAGDTMIGFVVFFLIFVAIAFLIFRSARRGSGGWGSWASGAAIGSTTSSWSSSDSSSSSSGDSFSGGGGGDSGGGGSSDSW